jgi:hypothetical protein
MYGRPPAGKGFFGVTADLSGAAMYAAYVCGPLTAGPDGICGSGADHCDAL